MATVVTTIRDDQLGLPSPCRDSSVAGQLHHVDGLSQVFAAAASDDRPAGGDLPPALSRSIMANIRQRMLSVLAGPERSAAGARRAAESSHPVSGGGGGGDTRSDSLDDHSGHPVHGPEGVVPAHDG
jgi:hypothetical protein